MEKLPPSARSTDVCWAAFLSMRREGKLRTHTHHGGTQRAVFCLKIRLFVGLSAMNDLINALPTREAHIIAAHLLRLDLHRDHVLVPRFGIMPYFYFPTQAVIAMRAPNALGQAIEIGLIDPHSVAGAHLVLGHVRAPCALVVVHGGGALALHQQKILDHADQLPFLWQSLQEAAQQQWAALAQEAALIAGAPLGWRLARLLCARFSANGQSDLAITHEELAQLLHARRAGITQALHALEGLQVIRARRGLLQLRDMHLLRQYIENGFTNQGHGR